MTEYIFDVEHWWERYYSNWYLCFWQLDLDQIGIISQTMIFQYTSPDLNGEKRYRTVPINYQYNI